MSQRPILKIRAPSLAQNPPPETPASTTSTKTPKLKLKFSSAPQTSIPALGNSTKGPKPKAPKKAKADKPSRTTQPTPKKRTLEASILSENDEETSIPTQFSSEPSAKRLKLTAHKPPKNIRVKFKGRAPDRPIGVGYDSGASDTEKDPALEEEFILRMTPGDDCEYLRQAVAEKRWGTREEGGADVRMTFLRQDGRRAIISIQKRLYAASMVDLPCIIEAMKSWDRRAWYKTADICQMLLVLGQIEKEEEALAYPLPREVDEKTWQYAHGLTPPMRWARKRRFRKRISNRTIEAVEEEVERLLALDEQCEGESRYEVLDLDRLTREQSLRNDQGSTGALGSEEYGEEDAEGEEDVDEQFEGIAANGEVEEADEDEDELGAELKLALDMDDEDEEPASTIKSAILGEESESLIATPTQPLVSDNETTSGAPTPAAIKPSSGDEDSGDEDEDEDATNASDEDMDDEDTKERAQALKRQREEIADLEAVIRGQEQKIASQTNAILKQKMVAGLQGFKRELQVKLAGIGEGEED
ncbi:MAG: hypothetical protein Q9190_004362 [Brigantiaea leucoxantha]